MSTVLAVVITWFILAVCVVVLRCGRQLSGAWREPMLARPVLIIESDDWGPGPGGDAEALRSIEAVLDGVRDREGRPAVMTLGVVFGIPDGAAMIAGDCGSYVRRTLADSEFAPIVAAMKSGCERGVFALQRHGLEHFWPASLLARLKDDPSLRQWLADPQARSEDLPSALQSRWVNAATLPSRPLLQHEVDGAIREEASHLQALFGDAPSVAVPNTFVWTDAVESVWADTGVSCVVTPGRRYEGRDVAGRLTAPTRNIRNGDRGVGGVLYVVRDDYFEPVRGHLAEQVWNALAAKSAQGRPTLLETHRESFIASRKALETALRELNRALIGALERHPALCFMSTQALAQHLGDAASPLCVRSLSARSGIWLRRVRRDPACGRWLKLTGLILPVKLLTGVLDSVKSHRMLAAGSR